MTNRIILADIKKVNILFYRFHLKFQREKGKKEYAQLFLFEVLKDFYNKGVHRTENGISSELLANELRNNTPLFYRKYHYELSWPQKTNDNKETVKRDDQGRIRRYVNALNESLLKLQKVKDSSKITVISKPIRDFFPNSSSNNNSYIFTYGVQRLPVYEIFLNKCQEYNNKFLYDFRAVYDPIKYPYIQRNKIENEIQEFINSPDSNFFVITGNAGVGKTCLLFNFAVKCDSPCFLFSGKFHHARKLTSLKEEINKAIKPLVETEDSLSNIQKTVKKENKIFIIAIDTFDDFYNPASVLEELSNLVIEFRNKYPNIKLLINCRKDLWDNLININKVFLPSFSSGYLDNYTDVELDEAMKLYSNKFSVELPKLTPNQKDLIRNPFFFRMTFETIEGKEFKDISFLKIFNNYWNVKIGYNSERELFVLKLADYINKVNESGIGQSVNPYKIMSLDWFNKPIFDSLQNDGVLIQQKWRLGRIVNYFHSNFYEFALAKNFIEDMSNHSLNFENLISNLKRNSYNLSEAIIWFLMMIDSYSRLHYCRYLIKNNHTNIIIRVFNELESFCDYDMEVVSQLIDEMPFYATCFPVVAFKNPDKFMNIIYKSTQKIINESDETIINDALKNYTYILILAAEFSNNIITTSFNWYKDENPLIKSIAIPLLFYCLLKDDFHINVKKDKTYFKNKEQAKKMIIDSINNPNNYVQRIIAYYFEIVLEIFGKSSKWTDIAKKMVSSSDEYVKENIHSTLSDFVMKIPNVSKEIKNKWIKDRNPKIRMAAVSILLEVDRKKSKYGLNIDDATAVKMGLTPIR